MGILSHHGEKTSRGTWPLTAYYRTFSGRRQSSPTIFLVGPPLSAILALRVCRSALDGLLAVSVGPLSHNHYPMSTHYGSCSVMWTHVHCGRSLIHAPVTLTRQFNVPGRTVLMYSSSVADNLSSLFSRIAMSVSRWYVEMHTLSGCISARTLSRARRNVCSTDCRRVSVEHPTVVSIVTSRCKK